MKHNSKLNRSRWLLLTLFTLIVGVSPAWGLNEDFESLTVDGTTLSNGWFVQGGTLNPNTLGATTDGGEYSYDYVSVGRSSNGAFSTYLSSNSSAYLIIPTELTGDVTFWVASTRTSSGACYVYSVTNTGETYNIGSLLKSVTGISARGKYTANFGTWEQVTVPLGDDNKMLAIRLIGAAIDDFSGEEYVEGAVKKPTNLTISSISENSATLSWEKGDEADANWQIVYSTTPGFDKDAAAPIDVNTTSYTFSELEQNTTYYVGVRTYAGSGVGEQSAWVSTSFKTTKVATPATGFTDNFETDKGWELINGTLTNKWVRGTATNNGGSNALYISNDGGTTNAYTNSSAAAMVYATKLFAFEAGDYTISYDWKANGESSYDFLRVALVPANVELTAGTTAPTNFSATGLPTGWVALDSGSKLNLQSSWQSKSVEISIAEAGNYQVVFAWRNDTSGGTNPPAAIDNFKILGAAPVLELGGDVVGTALAFGSVAETTNKTITITNVGKVAMENITLTETADEDNVFAYAALPKTTLAVNESMDVQATFSGSSAKDYTGTFRVAADDCDPIDVTVTATYSNSPATMAVTLNKEAVGANVAFGSVGKQVQKTFTVTNGGDQTLNITSIASNNTTDFTVSPATLEVAGHSSEEFTVTFVYPNENPVLDAEKTSTITVTASNEGIDPVVFTVTGTRIDQWSEDFSGNSLPSGWTADTNYWTFADGVAKSTYNDYKRNNYLFTPSLVVESTTETLTFSYTSTGNYVNIPIYYSKDGGDYTAYPGTPTSLSNGASGSFTITNLEAGNYKFRFGNDSYNLDNFEGFKLNANAPELGYYTNSTCTEAASSTETKDFGFVTEAPDAKVYYIKNDGTGTMSIALGDIPTGFTAQLGKASLTAGESTTMSVNISEATKGYHTGDIVLTAKNSSDVSIGTFTVTASGVMVDENKLNLNFTTDNIPTNWSNSNFTKNANGYIESPYGGGTLQTSALTAEAGETIVIVAKQGYSSSSYTTAVNYRKVGEEEWTSLIAAQNIYNNASWKILTATIEEAGNYELQFTGKYVHIQRIYGLAEVQEPVMAVYDGESLAGTSYNFGNVSDEADATWTLTVKNEGKAKITGLAAALSGTNAAHYAVTITGATGEGNDEIEADAQATITVKQLKDNLGSHEATLTISADDPIEDKVIALSGSTRDHTKLYVDFDNPNAMPEGWTIGSNWNIYTYGTDRYAYQSNTSTASSLITTPLTVAADETLKFQAAKYYSNSSYTNLKVRYTTNGGITWNEVNKTPSSTAFEDFELTGVPSGTVVVDFYGKYVKLDNLYGFTPTTAPMLSLTENAATVASESTKEFGNLTEDGVATYTLTNNGTADMVSVVSTTGVATAVISGEGEGITLAKVNDSETYNKVTLAAGKSATITLTVPFAAPYGEKSGAMTIDSEGWVGDMVVNYTATTIDPTAVYVDFEDNSKPAGWYNSGWTITGKQAANYSQTEEKSFITSLLTVAGTDDVLTFDARAYYDGYTEAVTVSYSTDRKNWTPLVEYGKNDIDGTFKTFQVKGLAAGNYYLKISGLYVYLDNIRGWHYKTPVATRDLYIASATFPTGALIPETENGVEASVKVYSLQSNETGVYAKLFFDETLVATSATQTIAKDGNETLELTGNVPATENTYAAKIVVYYSDNSVAFETLTTNVEVAHTRTLSITEFTRTDGDEALDADENNQISPSFSVTVENTGSTAATPTVKIYQGGNVVATATAAAPVAAGATSEPIALTATDMSAGEGGELAFTAKAYWTAEGEAKATSASDVVITVNAAAPKFALYQDATPVNNGDDVEFGLVKGTTKTYSYTIKNEGTADLVLKSIVAPDGFTATTVTNENKTIAPNGTLDITVTLNAEQGKKSGNLVITYKVDESTNKTFTLALSGRSVAADTWTEAFDDYQASIPANWTNNKWSIAGEYNDYPGAVYSNNNDATLISPRLTAEASEELTFDVKNNYYNTATYAIFSASSNTWSDEETISGTGEITFTAPAAGDYYLRLTGCGAYIQNFVGFKLATTVPVTISQYGYTTFASMSNIDADKLPDGVEVFYVKSVGGSYVHLTKAEGNIPAGTGLILKGTAEEYNLNIATGATSALEGNLMVGCLENTKLGVDASSYVLVNNTDEGRAEFQSLADNGITILAGKAYLKVDGAGARLMIFDDGETTGISSVLRQQARDGRVYNLNGQRVENPKKGQLYIINGKQTVVK